MWRCWEVKNLDDGDGEAWSFRIIAETVARNSGHGESVITLFIIPIFLFHASHQKELTETSKFQRELGASKPL